MHFYQLQLKVSDKKGSCGRPTASFKINVSPCVIILLRYLK